MGSWLFGAHGRHVAGVVAVVPIWNPIEHLVFNGFHHVFTTHSESEVYIIRVWAVNEVLPVLAPCDDRFLLLR